VSFNAGDTRAVVIEKVPVGASLSASATIGVPENLGYPGNAFSAATTSPITIQSGSNTITMWAQYPLECQMSGDAAGAGAAITGTAPPCYTNASSTPLPAASASYEDSSTTPATTMRFTGWSFTDGGVPGITSTSIPANVYKGKLSLYATYGECSLTITGATPPGSGGDPILLPDDTLSLTAVAEGFPAGSAVTYSWRIVPPATGTAPATVSGSGASAVVHPVAGAAGSATVEVTASNGTLSATAQLNIEVKVRMPGFTVTISPPASYVAAKSDETDPSNPSFALTDAAGAFSFTPVPEPGKSFPAGTTFSWDISVFSGASYGAPTPNTAVNEDASLNFESAHIPLGYTPTNAASITVSCTAHNPHALIDRSTSAHASAFMLYTLPDFTISVSLDTAGYNAGNSDLTGTDPLYALVNMGNDFTLTAVPAAPATSFPAGTEFEWTVLGTTLTGSTHKGRVITISPTAMGLTDTQGLTNSVSAAKNSPTGISISCTAKHADAVADVDGTDRTVNVYRLTIPAYKITVTPPTGIETETSGTDTIYLVGDSELTTKLFNLEVEPVNSSDSIPDGTQFTWSFDSTASTTNPRDVEIGTMCGITAAPATATPYTITCTASLTGAVAPTTPAEVTVKVRNPVISVTVANLSATLAGLAANDTDTPYKLKITGLDSSNLGNIKTVLQANPSVYVDLSETTLPSGDLDSTFKNCTTLVKAPALCSGNHNLSSTFSGCINLKEIPVIPDGVGSMNSTFYNCTSLTDLSSVTIPASVEYMQSTFASCTNLQKAPVISANLWEAMNTFRNCTSLEGNIIFNGSYGQFHEATRMFENVPSTVTVYISSASARSTILSKNSNLSGRIKVVGDVSAGADVADWPLP